MLTINNTIGEKRFETPINKGSKRVFKLMGDDYVTLKFSVKKPIYFELGDYCVIPGFGRFELTEPYQPTHNKSTGGYDYELKLEAQHMKWRNKILRYLPNFGGQETSWSLTATAAVHLEQVLLNIHALVNQTLANGDKVINYGYLYNGTDKWQIYIDGSVDGSAKTLTYDSTNIIDALTAIAEAFECEWWLNGNIICLGKCEESNEYIDLELGKNVAEMSRSDSKENYVTRIIAFGSERNISPRYRKDLIFDVKGIENGGNRISDTSRILMGDWFPASHVVTSSDDKKTFQLAGYKYAILQSGNAGDSLIYSEQKIFNNLKAGEWKLDFSKFHPTLKFDKRDNCENYRIVVSVIGSTSNGTNVTAEDEITGYIPYDRYDANITFRNLGFTANSSLSTLTVKFSYYVRFKGKGSIEAIKTPASQTSITLANSDPNTKISGLTIYKIDSKGETVATYTGAVFNPDFKDSAVERNWIQLPGTTIMEVGDRFRIKEIIENKVKSSYFSSRYSAYEDTGNVIKNGIVTSRLMLPESYGTPYVDYKPGLSMEQGVEDVVVFEDIYPRAICMVTMIETVARKETVKNDDGSTTDRSFTAYRIWDDFFTSAHPFSNDYIVPNETLKITFQDGKRYKEGDTIPLPGAPATNDDGSPKKKGDLIYNESGKLNGWTFEVQFTKDEDGSAIWEIVRDNTSFIPDEIIKPEIGDQFVLQGFDIAAVNDLYVAEAENELLDKTKKYLEKLNTDPSTYECTMMPDVAKKGIQLKLGMRVNLINEAYIPSTFDKDGRKWGRKSRVIGFEICLDIPYDNPVLTIGEKPTYSRFGAIEDQIDALKYSMANPVTFLGGVGQSANTNGIYVIGQTDATPATDSNVFSALRSKIEFLSKKASESINYLWTFLQGLHIGNYIPNNDGAKIDTNGDAEFNDVKIRKGASVGDDVNVDGDVNVGGDISVVNGVTIGPYQPGVYGGRIWVDENGKVHIETDYLEAREKLQAKEIEIQEETHVGGCQIISPAAMRCSRVIPIYDDSERIIAYKCFFTAESDDGTQIYNQFKIGDLAKCETFNLVKQSNGMMGNHYYWRKVVACGYCEEGDTDYDENIGREGFITLSNLTNEMAQGSDEPLAGDRIITVGNDDPSKSDRSNIIILASYGTGSPYIYQYKGITKFSLDRSNLKTAISPNGNLFTGKFVIESGSTEVDVIDYINDNVEAYSLVLSNEMAGVPCDADGNAIGDLPTSAVTIYRGKSIETGWGIILDSVGCEASVLHGTIYVSNLIDKNATITVTATKKDCPTLTKVMTIVKLKEGEKGLQGDHAVEFQIQPDKPVVLADMDGICDPAQLGCKVYMVIGKQSRIEVPLVNTIETTAYKSGDNLLFFDGEQFVSRPVEVEVPTDLVLRYVITNMDYVSNENTGKVTPVTSSESEVIYTGQPITTTARMRSIIFKLYRGNELIDLQTVMVTTDPSIMKVAYNTRFELTDKRIELEAERTTQNEKDIANLEITAEEIKATVSTESGIIQDLVNGAGRNLLLHTNQGALDWSYYTDCTSVSWAKYTNSTYPERVSFTTFERNDSTKEIFNYPIRPELIKAGEKYTLSFKIQSKGVPEALQFFAQISNVDGSGMLSKTTYFKTVVYRGKQEMSVVLEATSTGHSDGSQKVVIGVIPNTLNKWTQLDFWDLKLEKGSTKTPYSQAPEDREDYVYEKACAAIDVSAKGILMTVDNKIGQSENDIRKEYESAISQKADEILLQVNQQDDELGASISEIRQTATNISLKVDELAGYENLVTGNSTGQGWKVTKEDGSFVDITPIDGVYIVDNPSTSSKCLRTPLFNLKANKTYTLAFEYSGYSKNINFFSFSIKYGNAQTILYSKIFIDESSKIVGIVGQTRRVTFTFTIGDSDIDNAFVVFRHGGNKSGVLQTTFMRISEVIVETGEVAHPYVEDCTGLLSTGIDIFNKRIVLTADNIIFQNNKGEQSMFIDEDGHILAKFINVDKIRVSYLVAGDENGERVEITPTQKAVLIYDAQNELCASFNGESHPGGIADLYTETKQGNVTLNIADSQGCSISKGALRCDGTANGARVNLTYYSAVWSADSATGVIFNEGRINVFASASDYIDSNSGSGNNSNVPVRPMIVSEATVNVALYLEVAEDNNFTKNVKSWYIGGVGITKNAQTMADSSNIHKGDSGSGEVDLKNKSAKATSKGHCRVRMDISMNARKEGSFSYVEWGSNISGGKDLAAIWKNEFYVSNYFANGFCLGIRNDKYVIAYKDKDDCMHMEMEESGYGLKFSNNGIQLKHHGGDWLSIPLFIWRARVYHWKTDDTYHMAEQKSFNRDVPTVTRNKISSKHTHVSIKFPTSWKSLNLSDSNTMVNLRGYGDDLMKCTLVSMSNTEIVVEISDDETANDGQFIIEIFTI